MDQVAGNARHPAAARGSRARQNGQGGRGRGRARQPTALAHSNRLTMLWYFSMYHRFSLLYLGIATGWTSVPTAFQTQGHFTDEPATFTPGRLSSSSLTFIRVSTR